MQETPSPAVMPEMAFGAATFATTTAGGFGLPRDRMESGDSAKSRNSTENKRHTKSRRPLTSPSVPLVPVDAIFSQGAANAPAFSATMCNYSFVWYTGDSG